MLSRPAPVSFLTLALCASVAWGNDGKPDAANAYPAVGFYHVAFNYPARRSTPTAAAPVP